MPSRKDSSNRNEAFGRLLSGAINSIATYEGRTTPVVEEELGQMLTLSGKTIQRYKSGHLPPEVRAVEILAEAGIQRGYLGRAWLQRFLHAARYPFADKLLDRLCPIGPARVRPPRVYHNLPAPTYSQFVMRQRPFDEVIDGLQQRSAAVLIVGLGGNGKTSLAREVAARCLQDDDVAPRFDAAVWVSDKDRPGTTNLSVVLDEIARTLDYPGFTQFAHDEKLYEVGQLLKRQRVLVVVDNFETITDGALLTWLLRLPEPSKALLTSREKQRGLWSSWLAELRGMSEAEAQTLIHQRLRVLQLDKLAKNPAEFEPLVVVTGGNPKAIEIALGIVKHEHRPLQHVVDDLYAARGDLFDDLFTRAWALLDEAARRVLLVTTFFPASASGDALSATADVRGFAFDRAVERLSDLALLDVQQEDLNSAPRYALHPLVRAFAGARLAEQPAFEAMAREQWGGWYTRLASKVGYCWDDLSRLELLDPEQETIQAVIKWAFQNNLFAETLQIANGVSYYYYVWGFWDKWLNTRLIGAEAAHILGNTEEEVYSLSGSVRLLSRQNKIEEVEQYLPRLQELAQSTPPLPDNILIDVQHTLALYCMARSDLNDAHQIWQRLVENPERLSLPMWVECRQWLATCYHQAGDHAKAEQLFRQALQDAIEHSYTQGIISIHTKLAALDLDQGNLDGAETALAASNVKASIYRRRTADIQRLSARLHTLRGDLPAARASLTEAIDLFERLGMRRELAEAREALADLDAREQTVAAE